MKQSWEMDFNRVDPPDEDIPDEATCESCTHFDPCPCGCGHGRCDSWGEWTEAGYSGWECGYWA